MLCSLRWRDLCAARRDNTWVSPSTHGSLSDWPRFIGQKVLIFSQSLVLNTVRRRWKASWSTITNQSPHALICWQWGSWERLVSLYCKTQIYPKEARMWETSHCWKKTCSDVDGWVENKWTCAPTSRPWEWRCAICGCVSGILLWFSPTPTPSVHTGHCMSMHSRCQWVTPHCRGEAISRFTRKVLSISTLPHPDIKERATKLRAFSNNFDFCIFQTQPYMLLYTMHWCFYQFPHQYWAFLADILGMDYS